MSNNSFIIPHIFAFPKFSAPVWKYSLLERYKDLNVIWELIQFFFDRDYINLCITEIQKIIRFIESEEISVLCITDELYPKNLKNIHSPPICLYYKGNINITKNQFIAVVGTRKPSKISTNACESLSKKILERPSTGIISGLALGIDREIMFQSINTNLPLIGIMGTGFDKMYPFQNKDLYKEMKAYHNGLILTEMRPYEPIGKWSFPRRNRIIAGISDSIIIMEAPESSGALSTAHHGIQQNRDIFVFDHTDLLYNSGGRKLIEEGAYQISMDDLLNPKKMIHISELIRENPESISKTLSLLTRLEMDGKIKEKGGGYFQFF
jgi:DNA processing protein